MHFKHGFGVVQGLLSAGTVDVKFATKFQYVQASSLVNLDSERKRSEAEQARLKREKDDVREVGANYECGVQFARYEDIKEGDIIECFEREVIKKTLDD